MIPIDLTNVSVIFINIPTEDQIQQIVDLYRAQGWWEAKDEGNDLLIPRLISGSHCFVVATDGTYIFGIGRAISDGISDAYIQDLTVRKDVRNKGLGTKIINALIKRLHDDGIPWIGLISEPGSFNIYRKAGFKEMRKSIPMLLIKML